MLQAERRDLAQRYKEYRVDNSSELHPCWIWPRWNLMLSIMFLPTACLNNFPQITSDVTRFVFHFMSLSKSTAQVLMQALGDIQSNQASYFHQVSCWRPMTRWQMNRGCEILRDTKRLFQSTCHRNHFVFPCHASTLQAEDIFVLGHKIFLPSWFLQLLILSGWPFFFLQCLLLHVNTPLSTGAAGVEDCQGKQ